jgi:UDP-N-acetyl-D-galactosamine dehydrogenase
MIHAGHSILGSTVTVLGLTFKENCPDLRNSKVIDIIKELQDYGINVQVCDPLADFDEAVHEYGISLVAIDELKPAAAVIAAVAHQRFCEWSTDDIARLMGNNPVLIDVKGVYPPQAAKASGIRLWRL